MIPTAAGGSPRDDSQPLSFGDRKQENERAASGFPYHGMGPVQIGPWYAPSHPLELEFDIERVGPPQRVATVRLFIPVEGSSEISDNSSYRFFVHGGRNEAGIELPDKSKTLPCNPRQRKAQGIHCQMPLASGDLFSRVITAFCTAYLGGLHALAADHRYGPMWLSAQPPAQQPVEQFANPLPNALHPPAPEDRVNRFPIGEILWQQPPLTTRAEYIEDGIEYPSPIERLASPLSLRRQHFPDLLPLLVRQVCGILPLHCYGSVFLEGTLVSMAES